jgi:glycine oxidase
MPSSPDVLIAGGGVIGLTAAYTLAKVGATVTVLDRQEFGREASWAGAGIIPPGSLEGAATAYDRLRAMSAMMFPGLSGELRDRTGLDNGFRGTGGLEFDDPEDPPDVPGWTAEGIPWERLEAEEARAFEPALTASTGPAYYLPGMAQVRNPRHLRALEVALVGLNVTLRPGCPVFAWERDGERVAAAVTADGRKAAGQFLVCSGAWSDELLGPLGLRTGVKPVRGQIALLRASTSGPERLILCGKRYLVPRDDGRVLVGSTEEDAGFVKQTTAAAVADLLRFAAGMVPGLAGAAVERCWAGLRPGSPDGLPTIGPVPGFDNLWVATGHFRSGIQLSPATALVVAEAIQGRPTAVPLDPFRPGRPPAPPARAAFRA